MKKIYVTDGRGEGLTELSAFDDALFKAGIGNHNIIHLSSVIPLNHEVTVEKFDMNGIRQGDRVYAVYSENRTSKKGTAVAAGLGWVKTAKKPFWGLFVEHTGRTEKEVQAKINKSLESMLKYRTNEEWGEICSHIVTTKCVSKPVCALAVAIYKTEPW